MWTSLGVFAVLTTTFFLPLATSLTVPQDYTLLTPVLTIPTNISHPLLPENITATTTWPPTPFAITIPDQDPPASLYVVYLGRPGQSGETDALLLAIDTQIAHYNTIVGLPGSFTIENADVRFSLRLAAPRPGEGWLTKGLAIGALEVLKQGVEDAGGREMRFFVVSGGLVKATLWVQFMDLAGA